MQMLYLFKTNQRIAFALALKRSKSRTSLFNVNNLNARGQFRCLNVMKGNF